MKALEEVRNAVYFWMDCPSVKFGFFPASSTGAALSPKEELEQQWNSSDNQLYVHNQAEQCERMCECNLCRSQ